MSLKLLRYPGGKSRLVTKISDQLSGLIDGAKSYGEPFVGGGSVLLWIAEQNRDIRLFINDIDPDLTAFWSVMCGSADDLERLSDLVISAEAPLRDPAKRMDYFNSVRNMEPKDTVERAFRYFFLNKTCWGGKIFSTPIGGWKQDKWKGRKHQTVEKQGIACQYNAAGFVTRFCDAHDLLKERTTVSNVNAIDFVKSAPPEMPLYLDPPYFIITNNGHYRFKMAAAEHKELSELLGARQRWLLSYDDSVDVRKLYEWADVQTIQHFYASAKDRGNPRTEVLISAPKKTVPQRVPLEISKTVDDLREYQRLILERVASLHEFHRALGASIEVLESLHQLGIV